MTRARDNANKLSGGETIKIDNVEDISSCSNPVYSARPTGLKVADKYSNCLFSIDSDGKVSQRFTPEDAITPQGVLLLSNFAGIRMLQDGKLSITQNGGRTWTTCADIAELAEPPPVI